MTDQTRLLPDLMEMGWRARVAQAKLSNTPPANKTAALQAMAAAIEAHCADILAANRQDLQRAHENDMSAAMVDRLMLNEPRLKAICDSVRVIADLPDPVGTLITEWDRPNGLHIERVRTPLGVIGVIYESRPNVTADAAALCLKAGNGVILRGGSDSFHSSQAIHQAMVAGLAKAGLPVDSVQIVATTDRSAVGEMLKGLGGTIDVIVPRGGKGLVERVQADARVPVFAHLEGLCHIYVDKSANLEMARAIVLNAKMRRTGVCGAMETLLLDKAIAPAEICSILDVLAKAHCEIRGCKDIVALYPSAKPADETDWATEYLDAILSVRLVEGIERALEHINQYSSHHTEAVVAEAPDVVEAFFNRIDSAILLHNASTQFADGGEFGFGAEIGIATGKMHARGPIGAEQLTSFHYRVHGKGQTRP